MKITSQALKNYIFADATNYSEKLGTLINDEYNNKTLEKLDKFMNDAIADIDWSKIESVYNIVSMLRAYKNKVKHLYNYVDLDDETGNYKQFRKIISDNANLAPAYIDICTEPITGFLTIDKLASLLPDTTESYDDIIDEKVEDYDFIDLDANKAFKNANKNKDINALTEVQKAQSIHNANLQSIDYEFDESPKTAKIDKDFIDSLHEEINAGTIDNLAKDGDLPLHKQVSNMLNNAIGTDANEDAKNRIKAYMLINHKVENRTWGDIFAHPFRSIMESIALSKTKKALETNYNLQGEGLAKVQDMVYNGPTNEFVVIDKRGNIHTTKPTEEELKEAKDYITRIQSKANTKLAQEKLASLKNETSDLNNSSISEINTSMSKNKNMDFNK